MAIAQNNPNRTALATVDCHHNCICCCISLHLHSSRTTTQPARFVGLVAAFEIEFCHNEGNTHGHGICQLFHWFCQRKMGMACTTTCFDDFRGNAIVSEWIHHWPSHLHKASDKRSLRFTSSISSIDDSKSIDIDEYCCLSVWSGFHQVHRSSSAILSIEVWPRSW